MEDDENTVLGKRKLNTGSPGNTKEESTNSSHPQQQDELTPGPKKQKLVHTVSELNAFPESSVYVEHEKTEIPLSQYHQEILKKHHSPDDANLLVELDRKCQLEKLRNVHISLIRKVLDLPPPKESFNRWMMERKVKYSNTVEIDPLFPSAPKIEGSGSGLLFREISEDIPVKISMFPKTPRQARSNFEFLCRKCDSFVKRTWRNESLEASFSQDEQTEILNELRKIQEALRESKQHTIEVLLKETRKIQERICPVLVKKVAPLIEKICVDLENEAMKCAQNLQVEKKKFEEQLGKDGGESLVGVRKLFQQGQFRFGLFSKYGVDKTGFVLNQKYVNKLYAQFKIYYPHEDEVSLNKKIWHLLCRYETFFGSTRRNEGAGHQGAVPGSVMSVLKAKLNVEMECFASPMNMFERNRHFCSAFEDTDVHFGSIGSFFSFRPTQGSFEANPPFVEELMTKMIEHMENLLARAEANGKPLSFFIVVPNWEDSIVLIKLNESKYNRIKSGRSSGFVNGRVLEKFKHSYVGGFQHKTRENRTLYKAVHETRMFLLQSSAGAKKWTITEQVISEIMNKF